ncbi:MAG TPA: GAF domain-containing sensor histidine kinase [Candidatus Polarisedimenticolia bacterium]|nr:GAF domain-containing sensor histidine kinase [Candidatus Polarisedimenticolia bacterium]
MRKLPRSLRLYVAASTLYAALIFFAVQFIYTIELAQSGIVIARRDNGDVLSSIQLVSFIVWLGISLIAAVVLHRLATALAGAKSAEAEAKTAGEQKDLELGSIFGLSSALAGPLDLEQIGAFFVAAIRGALPLDMTIALIVYDDVLEAFRTVAADGPLAADLKDRSYSAVALPSIVRVRVIDHRQSLVISDTSADQPMWAKVSEEMPAFAGARSFAALPLVSRERLVGSLLLLGAHAGDLTPDKAQMPVIMGQYVAGSIHSALSVKEAEARAERETLVNRIAQRARGSLDPDEILRGTVDELAKVLGVSRAVVAVGDEEATLEVLYEWVAEGAPSVGTGPRELPVSRLAARMGRTLVASDVRSDGRFSEPKIAAALAHLGVIAIAATPVRVGGRLAGSLALVHTDRPREWTADDVRLIESVGRELRGAIAAAEAFEQQRQAVKELERLNRAKSDFVSIVSHEFRTPLTGIQGFSEMMQSEDLTLDEMREYAGDINKDAHRLNRMITEMLDLDKMESGRMEIHREPVDLNAIVTEAADRVRPNAPNHPLALRLDPMVGAVSGDRDKLTQVMTNLLSNAVKYSPDGGDIVVSTRVEGSSVHIVVRDHGMGIPKAALETIFERYGRVESLATRNIQGTGLGLPIVRQIVQLHGGAVWVESAVGEGSVFHVTLPRGAAASAEVAEVAS